jgi:Lar family restriction alleviation protein
MISLKPCPFCGSPAAIRDMYGKGVRFGVCCTACHGEMYATFSSREAAAERWNRRAPCDPPQTATEEVGL